MFFYLSKTLQALASPVAICLILMLGAIVAGKRQHAARLLTAVAMVLLAVLGSPFVAGVLVRSLESQYPDRPIAMVPLAQAIVVLGGSMHTPGRNHGRSAVLDSSDRILHAFRLYRAGKAPLVVVSSGGNGVDPPESAYMAQLLAEWGVPAPAVLIEGRARTTRDNAVFTHALLQARGVSKILLVTSAMHMPRAAALFRNQGFDVVAAPADFITGWGQADLLSAVVPNGMAMEASRRAIREWIGLLVSHLRGWV